MPTSKASYSARKLSLGYALSFFLILLLVFSGRSFANDYETYFNKNVGFSVRGPEHWFLYMREGGQVQSVFSRRSNLFAIFSKDDLENKDKAPDSDPMILIFAHPVGSKTAIEHMNEIFDNANKLGLEIIEPPKEIKLNKQIWAVMATKFTQGTNVEFQVYYMSVFPKGVLDIQAMSGSNNYSDAISALKDYKEKRKIFDDAVATTVFGNDEVTAIFNSLPPAH